MVNTFLRPSEIKTLKHSNIAVVNTKNEQFLRIQLSEGKTELTPSVSMPSALGVYESLKKLNDTNIDDDDYVFFPKLRNRAYAMQTMQRQFNHVLAKANLKTDASGEKRTLYSLRHTSLALRFTLGGVTDLVTLAKNARTSVDMLSRFYLSHLLPEMQVKELQAMKSKGEPKKKSSKKQNKKYRRSVSNGSKSV
jgi:hypothetical protein